MATPADLKSFGNVRATSGTALQVIPAVPKLPDDVRKRFPSLVKWEQQMAEWRTQVNVVLGFKPQ